MEARWGREDARHYQEGRWATFWGRRTHAREAAVLRILLSRAEGPGPWLDVPCGTGRLGLLLPPGSAGCDASLEMLRRAGKPGRLVQGSALALPFPDGTFAGVLSVRLLPHLPDGQSRVQVLRELARVSRGWVLVSFFHAFSLQHLRRRVQNLLGRRRSGRRASTLRWMGMEAAAAGLEIAATRPLARWVSEQWFLLLRRRG